MICHLNNDGYSQLNVTIRRFIQPDWFNSEFIKRAMKDIDHVYKIEGLAFYSYDHGVKSPESLSNGMKAILLLANLPIDADIYDCGKFISNCSIGINVVPLLQELSLNKDFHIAHDIWLPFDESKAISAKDFETGKVFTSTSEFQDFYCGRCAL